MRRTGPQRGAGAQRRLGPTAVAPGSVAPGSRGAVQRKVREGTAEATGAAEAASIPSGLSVRLPSS
eukprot:557704-Pyramimonas_sp.AAC.1